MRFSQRVLLVAAAITAMVIPAAAATARGFSGSAVNMIVPASHNYSGAWPVTITNSEFSNGTDCLTLTQNGGHGGRASLVAGSQKYPYGSFLVSKGILVVTITEPGYGQNGAFLFIAHANNGQFGQGIFEDDRGGSDFDTGALTFGMKGGC